MFAVFAAGFLLGFAGHACYLWYCSPLTEFQLAREVVFSLQPSWQQRRIIFVASLDAVDLCKTKYRAIQLHVGQHVPACVVGIVLGYLPNMLLKHDLVRNFLQLASDADRDQYTVVSYLRDAFIFAECRDGRVVLGNEKLKQIVDRYT